MTTIEADPRGAVSFLQALKQKEVVYQRKEGDPDWFTRPVEEVRERLGRDSLWDNPSLMGRGLDNERLAGVNIGGIHKVTDDFRLNEGVVTSMKSMDTHAWSYMRGEGIVKKGKEYVDDFENFTGVKTPDGLEFPADQIKGFCLEIAVRTDLTPEQREALLNVQKYGQEKGVRVIIAEVA